ncbi:hypothetical protein HMPREF0682_0075, partial [Propionibacterium acidifaciens F0233]
MTALVAASATLLLIGAVSLVLGLGPGPGAGVLADLQARASSRWTTAPRARRVR